MTSFEWWMWGKALAISLGCADLRERKKILVFAAGSQGSAGGLDNQPRRLAALWGGQAMCGRAGSLPQTSQQHQRYWRNAEKVSLWVSVWNKIFHSDIVFPARLCRTSRQVWAWAALHRAYWVGPCRGSWWRWFTASWWRRKVACEPWELPALWGSEPSPSSFCSTRTSSSSLLTCGLLSVHEDASSSAQVGELVGFRVELRHSID